MKKYEEKDLVIGDIGGTRYVSIDNGNGTHRIICKLTEVPALISRIKELELRTDLESVLVATRGNQTKTAEYFRVNRGTLRRDIEKKIDYIVVGGKVYKQVGTTNDEALSAGEHQVLEVGL